MGEKSNIATERIYNITFNMSENKSNFVSSEVILGTYESEDAPFTLQLIGYNSKYNILMFLIGSSLLILLSILVFLDILTTNTMAKNILLMIIIFISMFVLYFFLKPYYRIYRNIQLKDGLFLKFSFGFSTSEIIRDKEVICSIENFDSMKTDKLKKRRITDHYKKLDDSIDCILKIPGFKEIITWRFKFTQWFSFPKITKMIIIFPKVKRINNNYLFNLAGLS